MLKAPMTQAAMSLATDLWVYIRDNAVVPSADSVDIALTAIRHIVIHPEFLDNDSHSLTGRLRTLCEKSANEGLIAKSYGFFPYALVARWLLENNTRILLSLNPKLK